MKTKLILTIAFLGLFTSFFGQQNSTWDKWDWLAGEWIGEGSGQSCGTIIYHSDNVILIKY